MKNILIIFMLLSPLLTNPYDFKYKSDYDCDLEYFSNTLGFLESTNNYDYINNWGYLGKYQFSKKTLKGLGYNISNKDFINSPQIQDSALVDLLKHNKKILNKLITKYDQKRINNIHISEAGILAAAHLVGPSHVKKYLLSNGKHVKKDGLGTSVEYYLIKFSDHKLKME
jgi:hypothetical protein